ncbi:MAG TPA: thiol reductant ABC exporter subunit CydC [Xanthobacteraceae bacterium]|jgi:ATP-binding cassette subfamily C protein CydC|nr:thiol reductant ABC exporter subunit CydC [Xanthobacteraceae bacterium]HQS48569.1 thiol reductant ABC exporter subunit CydC [Xanthobacteraceae bacterium]
MGDLGTVLALFFTTRRAMLMAGLALAATTVLAGIALLGLSGWFISATAFAGLSAATALAFDVFAPAAAIRFLALARTAARYGERLTTHDGALSILAVLRERLFRGFAQPGAARSLLARPAKLLFRLTADIDALDSLYLRILVPAGAMLAAALVAGITLGTLQAGLGLAVAGGLLLTGFGLPILAARAARQPARRRAYALEALRARAIDLVAGQTELILAGRLAGQRAAIARADADAAKADDALDRIETAVGAGFALAGTVVLAGTLLAVGLLARDGVIGTPVAVLGLLVALAATEPFAGLRRGALELGRTLLAARRIAPRLRPQPPALRPALPPADHAARLHGVSARHEGAQRDAVHDLTLDIPRGARLAIIGASGAGKSTLLALLSGEMAPAAGTLEACPATLLTQRTELFQDSVRDNLRLAAPEATDARLWDALAAAGLAAPIRALPRGLDTLLGEGGLGLSGGESRRLALARLLLRAAPLWLLDEPTEGLDAATGRDVLTRVADHVGARTLVIATHIRREAEIADHLIILDGGRILARTERGTPAFEAALAALRPD